MTIELRYIILRDFKAKCKREFHVSKETTITQLNAIRKRYLAKYGNLNADRYYQKEISFIYIQKL